MEQKLLLKKLTEEESGILQEHNLKPEHTCLNCEETILDLVKQDKYNITEGLWVDKGFLCSGCRESNETEPALTILTNDEKLDCDGYGITTEEGLFRVSVGEYTNGTGGVFKPKYVRTDGWRGYYNVETKGWVEFHSDCILSGSEDSEELKEFDEELERYFTEKGVRFAKVFSRTSNVSSTGYDFLVKKEDFKTAEKVRDALAFVEKLKEEFRDEAKFSRTALTGSGKDTKEARLLVKAHELIKQGKDFDDVKEGLIGDENNE